MLANVDKGLLKTKNGVYMRRAWCLVAKTAITILSLFKL